MERKRRLFVLEGNSKVSPSPLPLSRLAVLIRAPLSKARSQRRATRSFISLGLVLGR